MGIFHTLWFLVVAAWVLCGSGWLTVELLGTGLPLRRRERLAAGFVVSAAWVVLLHTLVVATTGRLTTVLYALFFLTLGQALLLGARRLDLRRVSKRVVAMDLSDEPPAEDEPAVSPAPEGERDAESKPPPHPFTGPTMPQDPSWARWGLLALLVFSALLMLGKGGQLGFVHDSLDIVAYVRELTSTDSILPETSIYSPDPLPEPDPRRGTFHTQLALIAKASGADETDVWRYLPALLVPLTLLILYLLALEILASPGVALLSACLFLWLGYFNIEGFLRDIGFASRIGWVAGWVGWLAAHRYVRTGVRKLAFLAVLTALAAVGIHILSLAQYLVALGCLTLAAFIWTPSGLPIWRRALWTTILAFVATLPFLVGRLLTTYAILNPIFDQPQGLLHLGGAWTAMHPGEVLRTLGLPGLCAAGMSLLFWKRCRSMRGAAVLLSTTLLPLLIVVLPPTLMLLEHFHAHSLTFRLLLIVPTSTVLAWVVPMAVRDLSRRRRILCPLFILAVVALALFSHSRATVSKWSLTPSRKATWKEQESLVKALSWLESDYAESKVVLSDPLTSYAIPAYTRHHTVAPFHQHSSPTDSTALRRMEEAQATLNGFTGIEETCRILDHYGVDFVLLNQGFRRIQSHYGMFLSPLVYDFQTAKFEAYPGLFSRAYDNPQIIIYRYNGQRLAKRFVQGTPIPADSLLPEDSLPPDSLRAMEPRPAPGTLLGVWIPPDDIAPRDTLEVRVKDPSIPYRVRDIWNRSEPFPGDGAGLEFLGLETPAPVHPGEPLRMVYYWRMKERSRLPVESIVMFSLEPPRVYLRQLPFQPFLRRLWERGGGGVYRFGGASLPLRNFYPPFLWSPGDVYYDVQYLWVPPQALPGRYEIHLKTREDTFSDNLELIDLVKDDGSLVGPVVAEVEILPRLDSEP
jgi:hypothetical protein